MNEHQPLPRIRFHCDNCGRILSAEESYSGKSAQCMCGSVVTIPFAYLSPCSENPFRGFRIAGCRIDSVMGKGTSSTVYKGYHLTLDISVSVKILDRGLDRLEAVTEDGFLEEARILAKLNHPNIVAVINAGVENGCHFIVTRYVRGTGLGKIIRQQSQPPTDRLIRIFLDACRALRLAHRRSVVHGDVKPDHILITPAWRAILIDFGLVKGLKEYKAGKVDRRAIGTPLYMAPERVRGEEGCDARSDIYSLGATMYHAFAGRPPFDGATVLEILRKHAEEPLVPLAEAMPSVPIPISNLVSRAMEKNPVDRFPSMDDLYSVLVNAAGHPRVSR